MLTIATEKDTLLHWLGEAAKRTRQEAGVSPETIAPLIGMNNTTLRRFEQGETMPRNLEQVLATYAWLAGKEQGAMWVANLAMWLWRHEGEEPELPEHLEQLAKILDIGPKKRKKRK